MDSERFFGGSPAGVLLRLVILSVIVGIVLSALGITPANLFYRLNLLMQRLYEMGFGTVETLLQYFLIGAAVVFPIWLIVRLMSGFRAKKDVR
jgi:hypothetical protein